MSRFPCMQYCKTDLIATKGIVFVKYAKSSSACLAMETVSETGLVSARYSARCRTLASAAVASAGLALWLCMCGESSRVGLVCVLTGLVT